MRDCSGFLQIRSHFIIEANDLGVAWCSYNERKNRVYGKAAELCLANSRNNRVTTKKYIEYINSIHGTRPRLRHALLFLLSVIFLSRGVCKVLL